MAYKIESAQWTIPISGLQLDKRERKRLKDKRYYEKHKAEISARNAKYNREHPEQRRATCKRYYENNLKKESERQKKYIVNNPEKYQAHLAVQRAIRSGDLVRRPCEMCGATRASAHHDDYSRQLDVRWLCHKCHMAWHSKMRKEIA